MKTRALLTSRRLLLPATLLIGLFIGIAIGGGLGIAHYEHVLASNWADQAVLLADAAAEIDAADPAKARQIVSDHLRLLIEQLAMTMKPSQAKEHSNYLRKISTYIDASPGMRLSENAVRFLAAFPPLKGKDLDSKQCKFGVCKLAKSKASK